MTPWQTASTTAFGTTLLVGTLAAGAFAAGAAQQAPVTVDSQVRSGTAHYPTESLQRRTDGTGYAGTYRAGDFVYLSGVVASAPEGVVLDDDGLREAFRRMFQTADERLQAAGSSLHDTAEILTFHVWDTQRYAGTKLDRLRVLAEVKKEFIPAPHPAWTAVGVTELLPDRGLVEMRIVAYSPQQ